MAADALSRSQRARRYLQASMHAGYTGMPAEHREAYEQQMREHERAYPHVREHALAGQNRDFDQPLAPGEREHQANLREREGITEHDALRIRQQLRGTGAGAPRSSSPRTTARRSSSSSPARSAVSGGSDAIGAAVSGKGSLFLQVAGIFLGLSLLYLLLGGKNERNGIPGALEGLSKAVVGAANAFVSPVDPIASLEGALKANPVEQSNGTPGYAGAGASGVGSLAEGAFSEAGIAAAEAAIKAGAKSINGRVLQNAPAPSSTKVKAASPAASRAFTESLKRYQSAHPSAPGASFP